MSETLEPLPIDGTPSEPPHTEDSQPGEIGVPWPPRPEPPAEEPPTESTWPPPYVPPPEPEEPPPYVPPTAPIVPPPEEPPVEPPPVVAPPEDSGHVSESTEIPDPGPPMPDRPIDDGAVEPPHEPLDPWAGRKPPEPDPWQGRSPLETVSFLVHDATGRILRTGYCSRRDLRAQANVGETVMEGQANDRLQKVVDGLVTDKAPEEITQRQEVPPEKQRAFISQEEWELFQSRCNALDERLRRIEQRQTAIAGPS